MRKTRVGANLIAVLAVTISIVFVGRQTASATSPQAGGTVNFASWSSNPTESAALSKTLKTFQNKFLWDEDAIARLAFACRHHHLYASYPFFIPFPNLAGTFGAFIMIRSPMRTNRALFDVGASGPIVGFLFAIPALFYGVLHAKFVPQLANPANAELIYGTPVLLRLLEAVFHPRLSPDALLLPPVGRAAWVALFVTSLTLVPVAQLDGGHILRSLSVRAHRVFSLLIPVGLIVLGWLHFWEGWYIWGALLLVMRFLRIPPVYDPAPLDAKRRFWAFLALIIFVLCFMPSPISIPPTSP